MLILTHLERLPELVAHNVIQDGIDASRYKVENARDVGDNLECLPYCFIVVLVSSVNRKEPLSVEGSPAEEERYHHGHWNERRDGTINGVNFYDCG